MEKLCDTSSHILNKIKDLSNEIQYKIMSYTYAIQPHELLHDIKHYYSSKIAIERIYDEIWVHEIFGVPPPEDRSWLRNDIVRYVDQCQRSETGIVDHFYNVFYRYPILKTRKKIRRFVKHLFLEPVHKQIHIYWGVLFPEERYGFIDYIKSIHQDLRLHACIDRNLILFI